ncbi:RHS repeat-associated core domain-containing protein [Pseudomonas sp. Z1-12]|uniref:RHS repeat-associated core domain-containing protein n=1 Tax=Pseudomonas sp. Z1-12 TaxID=2817408 RepID=UPI003DA99934
MSANRKTLLCRYQYDPLDRLVDCTPSAQARTQRFYLKERLTSEIQGSVQRSIFQQADQLLAQQQRRDGSVETTLLATDLQRSVLHVLDATQPHPLAYTPYGHRPAENGLLSLLGFNGERPDPVTGHYLLGNGYRAFNPVLMRFNSPDRRSPFDKGGINAYAYVLGDPVNYTDPTGEVVQPMLTTIRHAFTIVLHTANSASVLLGPKLEGLKLWAARGSLFGAGGSVVGAAMQLAGHPYGPWVSTISTGIAAGGVTTRFIALINEGGPRWQKIKDNFKNILGLSQKEKLPVQPSEDNTPPHSSSEIDMNDHELSEVRNKANSIRNQSNT